MKLLACGAALVTAMLVAGCTGGGSGPSSGPTVPPLDRATLGSALTTTLRIAPKHVTFTATLRKGGDRPHTQTTDAHLGRDGGEQVVFNTDGVPAELRRMGGTAWLRSSQPAFTKELPKGKPWLRISASQATAAGLPTVSEILNLLYVSKAAGDITDRGMTTTDKVATRGASFPIDLTKAVCQAPAAARLDIATLMNSDTRYKRTMSVQVQVDAFHLIRRMTVRAQAAGITAEYDIRVLGDDAAVPVLPPADGETAKVTDIPKLDQAMSQPRPAAPKC